MGRTNKSSRRPARSCKLGIEPLEERRLLAVQPFPTPLAAGPPLGSLVYQSSASAAIDSPGEVESFTVDLDAGQTLTTLATGLANQLDAALLVRGPGGGMIGFANGGGAGSGEIIRALQVATAGTYTVELLGNNNTTGAFDVQIVLNASSQFGVGPNDSPETARNIDPSFAPLDAIGANGQVAQRAALLAKADAGPDWFRLTLGGNESATLVAAADATAGQAPVINLFASDATTLLASGIADGQGNHVINNLVNPDANGQPTTLLARVTGAIGDYTLLVTRNADFDTEGNDTPDAAQQLSPTGVAIGHLTSGFSTSGSTGNSLAVDLPVDLFDGQGFLWDLTGDGDVLDGTDDAYDNGMTHLGFPSQPTGETEEERREIVIGPVAVGDVEVSRKIYVPTDQGFARYLEIVTNTSATTQNYTVPIATNLGSDGGTIHVADSSGDGQFDATDLWLVTDDADGAGDPTILHVVAGEGGMGPAEASAPVGVVTYSYDLTLAPGETQIVMHFAAQSSTRAQALAKANALVDLGLGATAGMTAEEARQVVNFVGGDDDFYRFTARSGDAISISAAAQAAGERQPVNTLDPNLEIIDPSGALVPHTNVAGDELASFTADTDGEYTVRLFGAGTAGEYQLQVTGATAIAPPFEVAAITPGEGDVLNSIPTQVRVELSDAVRIDSIDAADLLVDFAAPATGVTQLDDRTLLFDLPAGLTEGAHTLSLEQGSLVDLQNQPLEALNASFQIDLTAPRVIASSVLTGQSVAAGALVYTAQFDEPLSADNIDASDVLLSGDLSGPHLPESVVYIESRSALTVTYTDLPDDLYTLVITSVEGSFEDLAGNNLDGEVAPTTTVPSGDGVPGGAFVLEFGADSPRARDFPTPFVSRSPDGSLIYESQGESGVAGAISEVFENDSFHFSLDAGQTATLLLNATFRSDLLLFDPAGGLVGSAVGVSPGDDVVLQTAPASAAGEYELVIRGIGGDIGTYHAELTLNAALELEEHDGPANDSAATAQDLANSFVAIGTSGAMRGAVLGALGPTQRGVSPQDWYQFELTPGESASLAVTTLSSGSAALDLFAADGTTLLASGVEAANVSQVINNFVDQSIVRPRTYFARVTGDNADYSLVVTIDADFDSEANNDITAAQDISGIGVALGHVSGGVPVGGPRRLSTSPANQTPRELLLDGATTPGFVIPEQQAPLLRSIDFTPGKQVSLAPTKTGAADQASPVAGGAASHGEPLVAALTQINGPIPILTQFPGPDSSGSIPPDPIAAAGPDQIVTMVNTDIAIYDKQTGAELFAQSLNGRGGFFGSAGATTTVFDPWILFDDETNRFFAIAIDIASDTESNMFVAVSTDATPTSGDDWHKYKLDFTDNPTDGLGSGAHFPDYPKLGVSDDAIYISGNYFAIDAGSGVYAGITAIEKEPLLSGGPANIVYRETFSGFSVFPMTQYESGSTQYFAESSTGGGSTIRIHTVTDVLTNPARTVSTINVPGFQFPDDVPQLGGGTPADSIDARIMTGVLRDGSMWFAHAIEDPAIGDEEAVVRWYEVDITGQAPALVQSGNVDPGPGVHAWMPAVAVDGNNNLGLGFALGGPNQFLGAGFTGRLSNDPPGETVLPVTQYAFGEANYDATDGGGRNRWGDYTGISIDPSDDATFWVFNEYAGLSNRWKTEVAAFQLQDPVDVDWYSFEALPGDVLVISVSAPADQSLEFANNLDPGWELYGPSGAIVAASRGPSDQPIALPVTQTSAGEWRVRVYGESDSRGEYVLNVAGATGGNQAPRVIDADPDTGARLAQFPTTYTLDFSETLLAPSIQAADLLIGGLPATSVTAVDGDTYTFTIDPAANVGDGVYAVTLAAGSVVDLQNVASEAFAGEFTFDTTGPIITSTLWNGGALTPTIPQGSLSFQATFSEDLFQLGSARRGPFAPAGDDVLLVEQITGQTFAADLIDYDAQTDIFTAEFDFLPEGRYELTLLSGDSAFEDVVGNDLDGEPLGGGLDGTPTGEGAAGGDYVVSFVVDRATDAPVNAAERLQPLGGLTYRSADNQGVLAGSDDADNFPFHAQAGQTVAVVLTPLEDDLTLTLDLGGALLTATAPGQAVVGGAAIDETRVYDLRVTGDREGRYTLDVVWNAALETSSSEPHAIDHTRIELAGGQRFAALGVSDPTPVGDGRLFATIKGQSNRIVELDPIDGSQIRGIGTPITVGDDNGLAFDGNRLFVRSGSFPATLFELDPDTGAVVAANPLPGTGDGLAALNGRIYTLDLINNDLVEFDPNLAQVTRTLDIDVLNPGVALAGGLAGIVKPNALVVALASGEVAEIDPATGLITSQFATSDTSAVTGLAVLGGEIYVGHSNETQPRESQFVDVYTRSGQFVRSLAMPLDITSLGGDDALERSLELTAEPNDTFATSILPRIVPGSGLFDQSGAIGDNPNLNVAGLDVDLVEVSLSAGDRIFVDIDASINGSSLDPILTLFDAAGTVVAQNDDSAGTLDSQIDVTVDASGVYFVGVSGFSNFDYDPSQEGSGSPGSTGPYDLQIAINPGPGPRGVSPANEAMRFVPDTDRYQVDLTAFVTGGVDIVLAGQDGVDHSGGMLELLNGSGRVVATGSPNPLGPTATNFDLAILDFQPTTTETYTIRVVSDVAGEYGLVLTTGLAFDTEPNQSDNVPTAPRRVLVGGPEGNRSALGFLGDRAEFEEYELLLEGGETVTISTTTPFDDPAGTPPNELDPQITVFNPAGGIVLTDENSAADGKNATGTFLGFAPGVYVVRVQARSVVGEYTLTAVVEQPVQLPGDYNDDGRVDAIDYAVWRENLGTTTRLPNDATPGVTSEDYDVWREHFGRALTAQAAAPTPPQVLQTPEAPIVPSFGASSAIESNSQQPLASTPATSTADQDEALLLALDDAIQPQRDDDAAAWLHVENREASQPQAARGLATAFAEWDSGL